MFVLDHVSISVRDLERARPFYDATMKVLGVSATADEQALRYGTRSDPIDATHSYFSVVPSAKVTPDDTVHWCFKAATRAQVDAFHAAAVANGGRDEGAPAIHPEYHASYYAAFVSDPDGNRLEVVCHQLNGR